MKAEKIISLLFSQNKQSFGRKHLWEQSQFLEKTVGQWENLKKVSPRQINMWSNKFWEMVEWFCASLVDELEIYHAKLWKAEGRQPPNYPRFLTKLHEFDAERTHQIMMKYPLAFSIVKEEWALWVQMMI